MSATPKGFLTPADKPRSRESKYYHARRARGDHLNRIWSNAETARLFDAILDEMGTTTEATFALMVAHMAKHWGIT